MIAAWIGASYLLGAIPTSYLVAKWGAGIDLRRVGSKNLGSTNLFRVLGWRYAIPVGLFDIGKGAIPVALFGRWAGGSALLALSLGVVAVVGHAFSIFVGFRGGKGVATGAGALLAFLPGGFAVAVAVWSLTLWLTGYVSLASILAAAVFPLAGYVIHPAQRETIPLQVGLALAVILLHRANIVRLLRGTEHRFHRGSGKQQTS